MLQNKSLEGNLFNKVHDYYGTDLTWKKNKFSATLGCIFTDSPEKIESYDNEQNYYRESKIWANFRGLCYLQLSYTFDFGKSVQRNVNQQLENYDNDAGIIKDNRAEQ
jgi:hypothetical protein